MKSLIYQIAFYFGHPTVFFRSAKQYFTIKPAKRVDSIGDAWPKTSIVIVTFNALDYIKICLNSLKKFRPKNVEIIVVDNGSSEEVKNYLAKAKEDGLIDTLHLSQENSYFSGGNNIGARLSAQDSKYLLLLNSDVEIRHPLWLDVLLANAPTQGIISFGKINLPALRPDGWCFLIDRESYLGLNGINEYYKMNWGITELTAKLGEKGFPIKTVLNHEPYIYHFGQKSHTKKTPKSQFNTMSSRQVINLFKKIKVELLKS